MMAVMQQDSSNDFVVSVAFETAEQIVQCSFIMALAGLPLFLYSAVIPRIISITQAVY